jgi:carboxyl-terminal processing protease
MHPQTAARFGPPATLYRHMVRRGVGIAGALLAPLAIWLAVAHSQALRPQPPGDTISSADPFASAGRTAQAPPDDARDHTFRIPSGRAPSLTCDEARGIVGQARGQLGYPPDAVDPQTLAEVASDWLDPYGLWSVAPDAPMAAALSNRARALLADLEGRGSAHCDAARELGGAMVAWINQLRAVFDEARSRRAAHEDLMTAASTPAFEGATVTRPARALAAALGRHVGTVERALADRARPYAEAARIRYFPALDADEWAGVVLAAAVRAYVPAIDPHGAWAPLDEESSVYEVDLESRPPPRLWEKAERTAIGIKIESGAAPPLADGDVVLSLGGLATAGLSYEQVEQAGYAASDTRPPSRAELLRAGNDAPLTTWLDGTSAESKGSGAAGEGGDELSVERIQFGEGDAVLVAIHDVRDDLGEELTRSILHERERDGMHPVAGVVLDLRGNGGGSTDGAIDALGLFIPGAPLFPMKRRDGTIETDRAPEPPSVDRWRGPVAALVDGDTASAAEMLAGALGAYRRGPIVGTRTFGKGCAQEYLDDDARAGVLRLTTLLYSLPDGTPVQRVGLTPTIRFPFGVVETSDREAALLHAPPQWRGPDVRDRAILSGGDDGTWSSTWPQHGGNVGPCKDADVCRALRLVGASAPTARRTTAAKAR